MHANITTSGNFLGEVEVLTFYVDDPLGLQNSQHIFESSGAAGTGIHRSEDMGDCKTNTMKYHL